MPRRRNRSATLINNAASGCLSVWNSSSRHCTVTILSSAQVKVVANTQPDLSLLSPLSQG
jgi:hypothetical protein